MGERIENKLLLKNLSKFILAYIVVFIAITLVVYFDLKDVFELKYMVYVFMFFLPFYVIAVYLYLATKDNSCKK
jgi:magnesium-transporting ATPase (P-type)